MKNGTASLRIAIFMVFAFCVLEFTVDSGTEWAIVKHPLILGILALLLFLAIAFEVVVAALQRVLFASLNAEAKVRYLANEKNREEARLAWIKKTYKKSLGTKPMAEEQEIVLDHSYDGIRELDNNLPPWWVYMFYATIIFAVVYFLRYEVFDGTNQIEEYEIELAKAELAIEEYKKNNKDLIDVNSVELLTDPEDLAAGKVIYTQSCIACHKDDGGGGIGPNLTDDYWILGGGIKEVYNTVSEGGRPGKGMIPWKTDLKPIEIAQVSSYVLSLVGTTPADPKAPEGDLWTGAE